MLSQEMSGERRGELQSSTTPDTNAHCPFGCVRSMQVSLKGTMTLLVTKAPVTTRSCPYQGYELSIDDPRNCADGKHRVLPSYSLNGIVLESSEYTGCQCSYIYTSLSRFYARRIYYSRMTILQRDTRY